MSITAVLAPTDSLRLSLGSTPTSGLQCIVGYSIPSAATWASQKTVLTADGEILSAPGSSDGVKCVTGASIYNPNDSEIEVTPYLRYTDASTSETTDYTVRTFTVPANGRLVYTMELDWFIPEGDECFILTADNTASGDNTFTGVNNFTGGLKIGGNLLSMAGAFTISGAYSLTVTLTGDTALTFPTSGTVAVLDKLQYWNTVQIFYKSPGYFMYSDTAGAYASPQYRRARGTSDTPEAVQDGDYMMYSSYALYNGTAYVLSAYDKGEIQYTSTTSYGVKKTHELGSSTVSVQWVEDHDENALYTTTTMTLGTTAYPWAAITSTTAVNVTSDISKKRDAARIDDDPRFLMFGLGVSEVLSRFRMKSEYAKYGEAARYHSGVIAQDILKLCITNGIAPGEMAALSWNETEETTVCVDGVEEARISSDKESPFYRSGWKSLSVPMEGNGVITTHDATWNVITSEVKTGSTTSTTVRTRSYLVSLDELYAYALAAQRKILERLAAASGLSLPDLLR